MKIKNIIILIIGIIILMMVMQYCNLPYAASTEPNWYGGAYDSSVNIFAQSGYYGQCTWYAWGRAYELTGEKLSACTGAASSWYTQAQNAGYTVSLTPRENSIACWWYGEGKGHVAFVESVDGSNVTVSECNRVANNWNWMSFDQGVANYDGRRTINPATTNGFQGYIYVGEDPSTNPKITWMTLNIQSDAMDTFEVRVWIESKKQIKSVPIKVWKSGTNISKTQYAWYDSNLKCWRSLFLGSDISGWISGTANVCCVSATATNVEDKASNEVHFYDTPVGGRSMDLGDFTARIVPVANKDYAVRLTGNDNGSSIKLAKKSQTDKYQIWKFTKVSGDYYEITNVQNNKVITVLNAGDSDGNALIGWDDNNSGHARFLLQKYQDGYRIIPGNSGALRAMDVNGGSYAEGTVIQEYSNGNTQYNKAQTFTFEKVATNISLNKTSLSLKTGKSETLKVTFTPTDVVTNSVKWKSSNTAVASVSSTGVVKGLKTGTTTITATTKDGLSVSKTCKVTVTSSVTTKPFPDVDIGKWYTDSVQYVKDKGLMSGYGKTTDVKKGKIKGYFGPYNTVTRGELVSILYRLAGSPTVTGTSKFPDVQDKSKFYYNAVLWANNKGVVDGYSSGKFGPNDNITREQLARVLVNYANKINNNKMTLPATAVLTNHLFTYTDASNISSWAKTSMQKAVYYNLIQGDGTTKTLRPKSPATRAEIAEILMRFCEM